MKSILLACAVFFMSVSAMALDVNKATAAQLQEIKGIGPVVAERIVTERRKGKFTSWENLQERINGIGHGKSKQFSKEGLTVGRSTYKGIKAKPQAKKKDKVAKKTSDAKKVSKSDKKKKSVKKDKPKKNKKDNKKASKKDKKK